MITMIGMIVIAFLGLVAGYILQRIAKEEVKPGKPYFLWLRRIILLIITILLIYLALQAFPKNIGYYVSIVVCALLGYWIGNKFRKRYFYLGLALATTLLLGNEVALIMGALIFLYGLPFGTQMISKKKISNIGTHAFLFAVPFLLLLTSGVIKQHYLLLAFTAGALFLRE